MTRLPGADAAPESLGVDLRKISAHLLDPTHPQNGGKARFLQDHGFDAETRAASLAGHPQRHPVANEQTSPHGRKFVVHCALASPDGRDPCITSVWIIDAGDDRPRLVTAYPKGA
ncbi:DUF6883 domain-containing protein [Sandarakinorhabdus sp.]|uniref:DUF6883 domain-containing protein n=1 Tax=Sandarakinorhabdus sp. TaxID=1916663 RepID=UPI003F72E6BB